MSFWTDAYNAWIRAGGPPSQAAIAASVASAESSSGTDLLGDRAYSGDGSPSSFGAWQIHTFDSSGPVNVVPFSNSDLTTNLDDNAKAAVQVYNQQGWNAWSTFKSGAYRAYLGGASAGSGTAPLANKSAALAVGSGSAAPSGMTAPAPIAAVNVSPAIVSGLVLTIAGLLTFAALGAASGGKGAASPA